MPPGELITRWTVRLALACYFAATILSVSDRRPARDRAARIIWTIGCAIFLLHVAAAFHFFHGWSHTDAYDATRRESRQVAGFDSGIGLWFNYLFTLIWVGETFIWWRSNDRYRSRRRWRWVLVHAFMLFMIFNATVVFEAGIVRWLGLAGCAAVLVFAAAAMRRGPV